MQLTREQICELTSRKLLAAAPQLAVAQGDRRPRRVRRRDHRRRRQAQEPRRTTTPIRTIDDLGAKISNAAGESSNYELVVKQMKLGGNGPIMANALASLGVAVTYVGNLGYPDDPPRLRGARQEGAASSASASRGTPMRWSSRTAS